MVCAKCGNQLKNTDTFCGKCGNRVNDNGVACECHEPTLPKQRTQKYCDDYGVGNKVIEDIRKTRWMEFGVACIIALVLVIVGIIVAANILDNTSWGYPLVDPVDEEEILIWRFFKGIEKDDSRYWSSGYDEEYNRDQTSIVSPENWDQWNEARHNLYRVCLKEAGKNFTISYDIEDVTKLEGEDKRAAFAKIYDHHTNEYLESWRAARYDEIYQLEVDIEIDGNKDSFDGTQYFWIYLDDEHWYIEPSNGEEFLDYILR